MLYSYKLFGTLGFHLEASPTLELHPGPPQHTQEELGSSSPHLLVLEVQDQTSINADNLMEVSPDWARVSFDSIYFYVSVLGNYIVILGNKCNGCNGEKNWTTSVTKSVPRLVLDKVRLLLVSGLCADTG